MPKSACEWKRTENRTPHAKTGFQKIGSPLERGLPRSSGPLGLQKYWLPSIPSRACTRPLERTACLHSSPLERQLPRSSWNHVCRNCWELDFSARAALPPARAEVKILEIPDCGLELQFNFPATILACKGSNLKYNHTNMVPFARL